MEPRGLKLAKLMPTSSRVEVHQRAPPELPGLIGCVGLDEALGSRRRAGCCARPQRRSSRSPVCPSSNGLPTATTKSFTRARRCCRAGSRSGSWRGDAHQRDVGVGIRNRGTSVFSVRLSDSVTETASAPSITWWLVARLLRVHDHARTQRPVDPSWVSQEQWRLKIGSKAERLTCTCCSLCTLTTAGSTFAASAPARVGVPPTAGSAAVAGSRGRGRGPGRGGQAVSNAVRRSAKAARVRARRVGRGRMAVRASVRSVKVGRWAERLRWRAARIAASGASSSGVKPVWNGVAAACAAGRRRGAGAVELNLARSL